MARAAASEEEFRFWLSLGLPIIGALATTQYLLAGIAAAILTAAAGLLILSLLPVGASGAYNRGKLALKLVVDLLEGRDVNEVAELWKKKEPVWWIPRLVAALARFRSRVNLPGRSTRKR